MIFLKKNSEYLNTSENFSYRVLVCRYAGSVNRILEKILQVLLRISCTGCPSLVAIVGYLGYKRFVLVLSELTREPFKNAWPYKVKAIITWRYIKKSSSKLFWPVLEQFASWTKTDLTIEPCGFREPELFFSVIKIVIDLS